MARIVFSSTAPTGFLIVPTKKRKLSPLLIQHDTDFPGVAMQMGWSPCHNSTDGTIDCPFCGRQATEMISEALDFIRDREGVHFPVLDVYFEQDLDVYFEQDLVP